jgi:hypothetical protein
MSAKVTEHKPPRIVGGFVTAILASGIFLAITHSLLRRTIERSERCSVGYGTRLLCFGGIGAYCLSVASVAAGIVLYLLAVWYTDISRCFPSIVKYVY